MPSDNQFDCVYEAIRESLADLRWDVKRGDDLGFPRLITGRIVKEIFSSDLVVADLTGGNPNVFYEVGLAHAVGNDLVLLSQEEEIPFDLTSEQVIRYAKGTEGISLLKESLASLSLRPA